MMGGSKGNRSPKRKRSPLPKVPHQNLKKRAWDYSEEENRVIAQTEYEQWKANLKKPKEPDFPSTPEDLARVNKMLKAFEQPPPRLTPDYDRSILKSAKAKEQRLKSSSASGKSVAQLGQQKNQSKNQSCPPLKVYSNTEVGSSKGAAEQYDPEFVALYGEPAAAHGMTIAQYLHHLEFPTAEETYKYRHGNPLVRPKEVNDLPTKMRRLHKWYMRASKEGKNWIMLGIKDEHYGRGNDEINIEFVELF